MKAFLDASGELDRDPELLYIPHPTFHPDPRRPPPVVGRRRAGDARVRGGSVWAPVCVLAGDVPCGREWRSPARSSDNATPCSACERAGVVPARATRPPRRVTCLWD